MHSNFSLLDKNKNKTKTKTKQKNSNKKQRAPLIATGVNKIGATTAKRCSSQRLLALSVLSPDGHQLEDWDQSKPHVVLRFPRQDYKPPQGPNPHDMTNTITEMPQVGAVALPECRPTLHLCARQYAVQVWGKRLHTSLSHIGRAPWFQRSNFKKRRTTNGKIGVDSRDRNREVEEEGRRQKHVNVHQYK